MIDPSAPNARELARAEARIHESSHPAPDRRWMLIGQPAGYVSVDGPPLEALEHVVVIPEQDAEHLREALRELVAWFDENDGVADDFGELLVVKRARAALEEKGKLDG